MHLDVIELRNFYYRTRLGRAARRALRDRVVDLWPDAPRQNIVGYGFATPLLRPYLGDARRIVNLMPARQGVMHWPDSKSNVSVLCEENRWPVETGFVDRLIVMHGLEAAQYPTPLLAECWRVLGPGGKAIFVVPNRAGLWSRSEATPFGNGRPYTLSQLEQVLIDAGFVPEHHRAALFQPPSQKGFWLKTGRIWERVGVRISSALAGGVLLVEVSKRVYAQNGSGASEISLSPQTVLEGLRAKPKPALLQEYKKPATDN